MTTGAPPSLRRLEVFCLVIDEGGVSRAAQKLFVAQPAVSSQLRELERWLGAALFVRTSGRLVPTEAGHRAYLWAKEMLAGSVRVRRDVQELADGMAGSVVVAATMAVGSYLLPPIMAGLRHERPGSDITVHVLQTEDALERLALGEADYAVLSWHSDARPTTFTEEHLRNEPLVLCTAPHHELAGTSIAVSALADLPMVTVPRSAAYQQSIEVQLQKFGVHNLDVVLRLGHAEAGKLVIREHGWFAMFPRYSVQRDIDEGRLGEVTIFDAALFEQITLFCRHGYLSPLQQAAIATTRIHLADG